MKTGAELITEERARQISQEEWSDTHDDLLEWGDLADAAEAYIRELRYRRLRDGEPGNRNPSAPWPWDADAWKPTQDPIRQLVKAGALIAAEIDRRQRAGEGTPSPSTPNRSHKTMQTKNQNRSHPTPNNLAGRGWMGRFVRRLPIFAYDAETDSVADCYCCQTAEEQAALRYGANWRAEYRASREIERRKRWPILAGMFPTNNPVRHEGAQPRSCL